MCGHCIPSMSLLMLTAVHCISEDLIDVQFICIKQYLQYVQLESNTMISLFSKVNFIIEVHTCVDSMATSFLTASMSTG